MLSRLGQGLWVTLAIFVLGMSVAQSRETREMSIAERIEASDAVFVGKAVTLVEPVPKMSGVNRYAVIEVQDVLKGSVSSRVNFVVSGYSAELNPTCCEMGQTYIFFSRLGYDVFKLSDGSLGTSVLGKDRFLSAVNGRFSTFLVHGNDVTDWRADSSCGEHSSSSTVDVYACIRKLTGTSTLSGCSPAAFVRTASPSS